MSETRERFNLFLNNENTDPETVIGQAVIYISELEQQIKELQESHKQKSIIKLCDRLDKAEQQNKDLLFWIFINEGHLRYYSLIDKKIEVMLKEYKKLNNIT